MPLDLPAQPIDVLDWDWNEYLPHFRALEARALDAGSVGEWLADWTALADLVAEADARLHVALDLHTDDEAARARYFAFLEGVSRHAAEAEQALKRKLLDSGLEPGGFAVPLRSLRAEAELFRPENVPLLIEHEKAASEYDRVVGSMEVAWEGRAVTLAGLAGLIKGLDRDGRERGWRLGMERTMAERGTIGGIWTGLMGLRARIAANAGKPGYRDYAWVARHRFDYSPRDCEAFRDAIERVAVPAAARVYERRRRELGVAELRPWDVSVDVMRPVDADVDRFGRPPLRPFADEDGLKAGAASVFRRVDPRLAAHFDLVVREGLCDLANYKGKCPGAYCVEFPASRRPFVLMNAAGSSGDVDTLLHEMGHAFHSLEVFGARDLPYRQQRDVPPEFAEVASMAMELLGSPFLARSEGGFYSGEEAARAMIAHLEGILMFWPFMAVVDGFQHWAYEHHEAASDPRNCDEAWSGLWDRFVVGVSWSGLEDAKAAGWQRKLHPFHYPFYYVEYGLAQLGAVQVWRNSLEDRGAAVGAYLRGLALGNSVPLPGLFAAAGAKLAFDAPALAGAVEIVEAGIERCERALDAARREGR